jgi:hypothetical protein
MLHDVVTFLIQNLIRFDEQYNGWYATIFNSVPTGCGGLNQGLLAEYLLALTETARRAPASQLQYPRLDHSFYMKVDSVGALSAISCRQGETIHRTRAFLFSYTDLNGGKHLNSLASNVAYLFMMLYPVLFGI